MLLGQVGLPGGELKAGGARGLVAPSLPSLHHAAGTKQEWAVTHKLCRPSSYGRHLSTLMFNSLLCCPCGRYSSYGRLRFIFMLNPLLCCPCCRPSSYGHHLLMLMLRFLLGCPCCRYSSYGRHFTKEDRLRTVARKLATFLEDGDLVRSQPVAASCMTAGLRP